MNKEPYSFCFLRYVHDPLSGEFANIGVLVWAPQSQFLGFEASGRYSRLSNFFGGIEKGDYANLVARLETRFRKLSHEFEECNSVLPLENRPESAREIALRVVPHDSAALQWSHSGGGLTTDPEKELQSLYQQHIGRFYVKDRNSGRDERAVFKQVYQQAFRAPGVVNHLSEHLVKTALVTHTFPQAWENGVWNVYETLSFDLVKPEQIRAKAYRWESMTRWMKEAENLNITYLLGSPGKRNHAAYDTAKLVLEKSKANLIEEDEVKDFARSLKQQVKASAH